MDSNFLYYLLMFVIYPGFRLKIKCYTLLASCPRVFKSAPSMMLSLIQSPGKLTGNFSWANSRKAE